MPPGKQLTANTLTVQTFDARNRDLTGYLGWRGSGVGNMGRVEAAEHKWHGRTHSLALRLPPLSVMMFTPEHAP